MKTCPKCHKEFEDLYAFCIKDGTPLESVQAEKNPDIEQVTVLRPQTDPPPIPPPIGEETAIMDSSDITPVGEETEVMSDADIKRTNDADNYEEVEDFDAKYGNTQDLGYTNAAIEGGDTVIPDQDLDEEYIDDQSEFAVAQVPIESEETTPQSVQSVQENNKSKLGLILAGIGLLGLLLVGTAAIGIYLYMQSGNASTEIASANTEDNSDLDTEEPDLDEDPELDLSNINADENFDNSNLNDNLETDSDDNKKDKQDKDRDKDKVDKKKNQTPKPTPKSVTTVEDSTPTPQSTPNFDIGVSTPRPTRTPTPRPTRTPTPRPTQTQRNVPNRIAGGVVNGKARSLPKPVYPSAARAANVRGSVNVAVVIGKNGRVISASAVSGHPLLRGAAVSAARRAKFAPTRLSGQAVEVSGVIVYNFQ